MENTNKDAFPVQHEEQCTISISGYYDEVEWRKCTSLKLIDQYNLFQYVTFNKDGTGKWLDTEPKQAYVDYDFCKSIGRVFTSRVLI